MVEGTGKLTAMVAAAVAKLEGELRRAGADLLSEDLLVVERRLQQVFRQVGSVVGSGVLQTRAAGAEGQAAECPVCGGRLHLVGAARERTVLGLVGEYRFARPTFTCGGCQAGYAPLDEAVGLGAARLSPALAQVLCQAAAALPFAEAGAQVQGSLGVAVDGETIRRLAEGMGAVIEHDQADRTVWALPEAAVPACLLVEADGVHTPLLDGYHETKVGRVAALGPALRTDPETGRLTLVVQPSCFCSTLEGTDAFFPRLTREAWRAGFTRGVRQVVFIADGGEWIWHQARTQFSQPGVEVVEMLDYYHACEHLAEVAKAVHGTEPLRAATWFADQKHALLHQGPAPVLAALDACRDRDEAAPDLVRRTHAYFTAHAARMDYPAFADRHFPLGSGAIESACKLLISQREKLSGMRWSPAGAQQTANLRALYRSAPARWTTFWASQPLRRARRLAPPAPPVLASAPPTPASKTPPPPPILLPAPAPTPADPSPTTARIATAGKPWAKGKDHWRHSPIRHLRSA
jgi:hypothetical protein